MIEKQNETTVIFTEGANQAYLGYVTVRFSPDPASNVPHHQHFCIEVVEQCQPIIDHCVIRSSSVVGAALCVRKAKAQPTVKHCTISDCENVGIYITDQAQVRRCEFCFCFFF